MAYQDEQITVDGHSYTATRQSGIPQGSEEVLVKGVGWLLLDHNSENASVGFCRAYGGGSVSVNYWEACEAAKEVAEAGRWVVGLSLDH